MKRRKNVEKSDKYECDIGRIIIKKRIKRNMAFILKKVRRKALLENKPKEVLNCFW